MTQRRGTHHFDGGWWPRSRDLAVELADLLAVLPERFGRVERVLVQGPAWDAGPAVLRLPGGDVAVERRPDVDAHLVRLTTDRTTLDILVVPASFTESQGAEALLAAASRGNSHAAVDLLREVLDQPDVDPLDQWSDGSPTWWGPERGS